MIFERSICLTFREHEQMWYMYYIHALKYITPCSDLINQNQKKTGLVIDVGKKTTTDQHLIEFAIGYLTFFTVLISKYLIKVKLKCLTTERGVHIGCD